MLSMLFMLAVFLIACLESDFDRQVPSRQIQSK